MKRYVGKKAGTFGWRVVVEDGDQEHQLAVSTPAGMPGPHSPDGHSWGYSGSGPTQLAHDVLRDCFGKEPPRSMYMAFREAFTAAGADHDWSIDEATIRAWLADQPLDSPSPFGPENVQWIEPSDAAWPTATALNEALEAVHAVEFRAARMLIERVWATREHIDYEAGRFDWEAIEDIRPMLSDGERILVAFGKALWTGHATADASISAAMRILDDSNWSLLLAAIQERRPDRAKVSV
jgi:hypothetical protein